MRTFVGALAAVATLGAMAQAAEPFRVIYPKQDRQVGGALAAPLKAPAFTGPLRDYLREIARAHRINVIVDETALTDAGVDIDNDIDFDPTVIDPVRAELIGLGMKEGLSLKQTLRFLLEPYDLTYVVEDGVLKITTDEAAADRRLLRAYDVTALLDADTSTEELAERVARLAASLGPGTRGTKPVSVPSAPPAERRMEVVPFKTTLIVTGGFEDHRRVEQALEMMREVVGD